MLFLTQNEVADWTAFGGNLQSTPCGPEKPLPAMRKGLVPAFHYYIGTLLLSTGHLQEGTAWIRAGIGAEPGGLFSNSFLASYLERHGGRLIIPETVFSDPAPYIHFNNTPVLRQSREKFRADCAAALPVIRTPLKIMDIGCGHGQVLTDLLVALQAEGCIGDIEEVFLADPSEAMLALARQTVESAFPGTRVRTARARFEELSDHLEGRYHIALASLSIHHMPYEQKLIHLGKLRDHIDCFILYELDANNDTPELHSPELALSVYQSYGAIIDFVFAYDAPVNLALASIDRFLMSEAIGFFTEPRGKRTDYHMLRDQWHRVFRDSLGKGFGCLCDATSYADGNIGLFTMIYGRDGVNEQ